MSHDQTVAEYLDSLQVLIAEDHVREFCRTTVPTNFLVFF